MMVALLSYWSSSFPFVAFFFFFFCFSVLFWVLRTNY